MKEIMKFRHLKFAVWLTLQKIQCHSCQIGFINLLLPARVEILIVAARKHMRLY